jgi:HSP20 family molecular chaperone IbpA
VTLPEPVKAQDLKIERKNHELIITIERQRRVKHIVTEDIWRWEKTRAFSRRVRVGEDY